ncbi:hypothetical protein [Streptomyces hoynatensis]|uniref:Uncharacterized protein n=1 Tax=Streptomyces hoynatensis TaxID=1141874 RepID=A0A3A9YTY4_9ACTN|nr:hypothetical protein [Streptomyces hoynatensis]RKN38974.1 hypothetical protein D7294_22565 [Streptomyces hoynatensis]
MDEWGIALIAAGSALAGSLVTGWFTWIVGNRQAEAARHAGDRQADALLDTVRRTLEDGRAVRLLDLRRQTYVQFLQAAHVALVARRSPGRAAEDGQSLARALAAVELEGPGEVAHAARGFVASLSGHVPVEEIDRARDAFADAARAALSAPVPS